MLDKIVLADEVSHLLRTKYAGTPSKEKPFNLAATEVMDKRGVVGEARYLLKQEIGTILQKRRKGPGTKEFVPRQVPKIKFGVVSMTRSRVVLSCAMMGDEITYVRDTEGKATSGAHKGNPPAIAIQQGAEYAQELFATMDDQAIREESVILGERSDDLVTLSVGNRWKMIACRGVRGSVIAQVTEIISGRKVRQRDVNAPLLLEARAIAKWHFRDSRTGDLFAK